MNFNRPTTVTTGQGDVLDALVAAYYGSELPLAGAIDLVLAANPGLGARERVLPHGVLIVMPTMCGL
ncbi:MAG: phage tail protein [Hyphomonadaceae bacterium]|nr:phage tail protein [Hyphomonadaceae bacterium]